MFSFTAAIITENNRQDSGTGGDGDVEEEEFLRLVKGFSADHVKMGANVSRHSSKGLSGRRSQSSGSICHSKGRHTNSSSGDGKICGSLPSYLEDRDADASSCNNNHQDYDKRSTSDVSLG